MVGSVSAASATTRSGNDNSILSSDRNSIGTPRGVPDLSVARLTTPTAAWSANNFKGSRNFSARGRPARGSLSCAAINCFGSANTAAAAIAVGRLSNACAKAASPSSLPRSTSSRSTAMARGPNRATASTIAARSARDNGSPPRDPATQDQNRRPCFLDIYRPFGAAHGGDGLRRRDLKAIFALLLGSVDQQGLALQIDGIDFAVVVAVFQGESGAVLGNDG